MRHPQGRAVDSPESAVGPDEGRGLPKLNRVHGMLICVVVVGAVVVAGIGFAGSYTAVRELAQRKGFGAFSYWLPIGIDAGICVLLALDLLLTWMRIPFPLLRQTAWLLTAATIAFNCAAAWPDPIGVGMHGVMPVLFVVTVEAARHAVGRTADVTADKHMEGVRLARWLLSPVPTFKLWRRMRLWELRSYQQAVGMEQERLIYQAQLHARYGKSWRRKAPVTARLPLRLARYGLPLSQTTPDTPTTPTTIDPAPLPPTAPSPVGSTEYYGHDEAPAADREGGQNSVARPRTGDGAERSVSAPADAPDPAVDEAATEAEPTSADPLEYRYLQLTPEQRARSASALARALRLFPVTRGEDGGGAAVDDAKSRQ